MCLAHSNKQSVNGLLLLLTIIPDQALIVSNSILDRWLSSEEGVQKLWPVPSSNTCGYAQLFYILREYLPSCTLRSQLELCSLEPLEQDCSMQFRYLKIVTLAISNFLFYSQRLT